MIVDFRYTLGKRTAAVVLFHLLCNPATGQKLRPVDGEVSRQSVGKAGPSDPSIISPATALSSGTQATFTLPARANPTLFTGDYSYTISVPAGTTQLKVDLTTATPNVDVDLYVRLGQDIELSNGMVVADYRSEGDTANESISVNSPAAGTYYIGFLLWTTNTAVTSTVTATITTGSTSNLAGNTLVVPQFINGGGWTTVLFLTNTSSSSENYTIRFFDNTGAPRQVAIQGSGTINTLTGSVSPGQIAVFQTSDAGTLALGWAAVIPGTANATRLNMFTVFRFHGSGAADSEAIVTPGNMNDRSLVFVYDNASGFSSGVALVNPNSAAISLAITIRGQNGGTLGSDTINLAANSQTSFFTADRFPATANNRGSIVISSNSGFAAVGLRFSPGFATFTSFPPLK